VVAIPLCAVTVLKGTEVRDFKVRVVIVTNAAFKAIVAEAVLVAVVAAVAVMVVAVVAVMAVVAVAVVAVTLGRGNTITIRLMQVRQNKVETIAMGRRQTITRCHK